MKIISIMGAALLLLPILTSCQKSSEAKKAQETTNPLITRGKGVYLSNCIACHNPDPKLDGSIGPAVANSSLELITHRLLTRDYPPGYKPKRPDSSVMPDFPQLKDDIPAIHAYLNNL